MQITCIVDDRVPPNSGLQAEHGISFVIETGDKRVLFDTGQSGEVLLSNLAALGFAPADIDALILSHAHNDHTGGVNDLLEKVQEIPLYAHPDLFRGRYREKAGVHERVGPMTERAWLEERVQLRLSAEPVEVVPSVWTSGGIVLRSELEGRSRYHHVREGDGWIPDPYLDDLSVVLEAEPGLVLVCGCCHAGLLNVLVQVRSAFGRDPVAIVGGVHLAHADAHMMERVVEVLRGYGPPQMWLGHCTGEYAFKTLQAAFGGSVRLCQGGTVLNF